LSSGGAEVDITGTGTGVHTWHRYKLSYFAGYDTNCAWKSIIIPLIGTGMKGMIDKITVSTKSLGAGARCDLTIEANQTASTSNTMQITTTAKRLHSFTGIGLGNIEDFRLALSWANGNATYDTAIRKVIVSGHYVEN